MIVVWIPVALALSATLLAVLLAWLRGAAADRTIATGYLAAEIASLLLMDWDHWLHVQIPVMAVDVALLAVLVFTTARWLAPDRILLSALQLLQVGIHVARGASPLIRGEAYAFTTAILTYLEVALLLATIARARGGRRKTRSI